MNTISIGKFRGFQLISSATSTVTVLAIDHRQNLRRALNSTVPASISNNDLSLFKLSVTKSLADLASAILLDSEYSAAQAIAANHISKETGLVVAVESTGYDGKPTARLSKMLPRWSLEKAKRMGADDIKLLVYFHSDSSTAPEIVALIKQVVENSKKLDTVVMLEPLSFPLDPNSKKLNSDEKKYVVTETARQLSIHGVDLLKVVLPLDILDSNESSWVEACNEISSVCVTPWIVLSGAATFETFTRHVLVACQAGASGTAVGRAVWQEAVEMNELSRQSFLNTVGRKRLIKLNELCSTYGRPINDFYRTDAPLNWNQKY